MKVGERFSVKLYGSNVWLGDRTARTQLAKPQTVTKEEVQKALAMKRGFQKLQETK